MQLNKDTVATAVFPENFIVPNTSIFQLPEKVLQFGTGVLLRGLPDFYIDKANKQNIFNGRVVVVKSTGSDIDAFTKQDGLYTHCIKGIDNGNKVEAYIINASISKVLSAKENWDAILKYAESEAMQIIISNTTEVGIILKDDDDIHTSPPESFPAKLLAFLYHRFKYFDGTIESGMVIIPTELIVDNGNKLKAIVNELAVINNLDKNFLDWLNKANDFCNSLVDRIVPGALKKEDQLAFETIAGYKDDLAIMSEPYSLWAIESSSQKTKDILSFYKADESVIITNEINKYRELKLRLLNGTHSFCCGLAFLAGFNFVHEAMRENWFNTFIKQLMLQEITTCITGKSINNNEAEMFEGKVIERFSNTSIEHKWLSITMQYSAKMKMRNVPLLLAWYQHKNIIPVHMATGFAAYILFMKPVQIIDNIFYGMNNEKLYKINDAKASYFHELWQQNTIENITEKVLSNTDLWDADLNTLNGFTGTVQHFLRHFSEKKFQEAISNLSKRMN